ncbi:hypothetical protein HBB16_13200 [Pseudonocardia sp. MCCB 268]|nr:hypothetical protein [Pseudonocardia cytotoxica]
MPGDHRLPRRTGSAALALRRPGALIATVRLNTAVKEGKEASSAPSSSSARRWRSASATRLPGTACAMASVSCFSKSTSTRCRSPLFAGAPS